jgi:ankyrin repeat protein
MEKHLYNTQSKTRMSRLFKALLAAGASIEACNRRGRTPLATAATDGEEKIVRLLLDRGAEVNSRDYSGRAVLHAANMHHRKAAIAQLLLDRGALVDARDSKQQTPLHFAARNPFEEQVEVLLDRGANVNALDSDLNTPLHLAANCTMCRGVAQLLFDQGAMINMVNAAGEAPLDLAILGGKEEMVELLLEKGAKKGIEL